jgi:hypothetical protein
MNEFVTLIKFISCDILACLFVDVLGNTKGTSHFEKKMPRRTSLTADRITVKCKLWGGYAANTRFFDWVGAGTIDSHC